MFFSRKARSFGCQGVDAVGRTVSAVVVTDFTFGVIGMERIRREEEILGLGGRHS